MFKFFKNLSLRFFFRMNLWDKYFPTVVKGLNINYLRPVKTSYVKFKIYFGLSNKAEIKKE